MDNNNQPPGPNNPNQGNQEPPQPKRQRLHSPMLGGDDPDDEAYAQNNYDAPKAPKAKGGLLRSPLLGGGNAGFEEESEPVVNSSRPAKGPKPASKPSHLRSPLLGGSADDEDDYEEDFPLRDKHSDKSSFPHRRSTPLVNAPEPAPGTHTGGRPHLRSPLLQGDDEFEEGDNYSDNNYQNQAPAAPQGRPAKLHSPLFGKQNGVYDYIDDEDQAPSVNDNPNALRSPLLAARSPMPQDTAPRNPVPAAPRPVVQPPVPQQPAAQAAPAPLAQPASLPPFPNPRPMSTQPPAIGTPLPMTPAITPESHPEDGSGADGQDPFAWRDRGFSNAAPSPGVGFAAANSMPTYGAPGMPQPAPPLPNPTGFAMPTAPEPVVNAPIKASPVPTPPTPVKLEPKLKSKLLSGSGDSYNDDYEDDYKASPQSGRKRFGDDSHQSGGFQPGHGSSSAPSGPIMVIAVPAMLATMGKAYYLFALAQGNQLFSSAPFMADEFGQLVVLIALVVYGFTGNKR
ncbi:MAG: hypothetical protein P4L53_08015 [Candidatus Obscuribacterales bacterium]|nr:hypothetical protein [Candidatus Obscuribacterales bacterium]